MKQLQSLVPDARAALEQALDDLNQALNRAPDPGNDIGSLGLYTAQVGRIAEAAADAGCMGLPDVCRIFQDLLQGIASAGGALSEAQQAALRSWPKRVRDYLSAPSDRVAADALANQLADRVWGVSLSDEDVETIRAMLVQPAAPGYEPAAPSDLEDFGIGDLETSPDHEITVNFATLPNLERRGPSDSKPDSESTILWMRRVGDWVKGIGKRDEKAVVPAISSASGDSRGTETTADGVTQVAQTLDQLPPAVRELVEILVAELPQLEIALDQAAGLTTAPAVENDVRMEAYEQLAVRIERFGGAAEAVGFAGLLQTCELARENVLALAGAHHPFGAEVSEAFRLWLSRLREYLLDPGAERTSQDLVEALSHRGFPRPADSGRIAELSALLRTPDFAKVVEEIPVRATVATAEDVSLELPIDVNQDLLDGLLQELPGQTEAFTAAVQRLLTGGSLDDVDRAQRAAHTLKGAGNTVGIRGIATLTHQLEDILLVLKKHEVLPSRSLSETMLTAADCLAAMSEYLAGSASPPADALSILQDVLDWANRIDSAGVAGIHSPQVSPRVVPSTAAKAPDTHAPSNSGADAERSEAVEATPILRIPATLVDDLLRLAGENIILTGQLHERLRRTAAQTAAMQSQFDQLRELAAELEEFIDITDLNAFHQAQGEKSRFDSLELDQYSELYTYSRRMVEAATDAREMGRGVLENLGKLEDMLVNQERTNRETQEAVLRTRMVPVKTVFPRLQRSVRQTSRMTGKQAELYLKGGDTLMDSDVLNNLADPLMHILRNSVDHGIEEASVRIASGKKAHGNIWLEFFRDGNNIVVRCIDDGRGLDYQAIRQAAAERGIISSDRQIPEEELKRFILRPNFTTRAKATLTSGRGIGLDAVYSSVVALGGSVNLQSELNTGLTVELRLPMTLISTHALLVQVGPTKQTMAVSNRGVEQIFYSDGTALRYLGNDLIYQTEKHAYPARLLDGLLNLSAGDEAAAHSTRPVILVNTESGLTAVLVARLVDTRDLVVKHLGQYLPKMRGIVGATILGDGSVAPVLDLPELLRIPYRGEGEVSAATQHGDTKESRRLPMALVVDDSLSARRSMAQFISDSGYEVREARDGLEAIERIAERRPDILIVDLEMPRMNGIELTTHVRGRSETAHLPIIMVTSRSTQKHREEATRAGVTAYMSKPFSEEQLLHHVQSMVA